MTAISAVPAPPKPLRWHDLHVELGATMTDFAGWSMPLRIGSETTEHRAVRTAAGLSTLSHMGEIEVAGPAAAAALHQALVGDIAAHGGRRREVHDDLRRGRRHHGRPDRLPPRRAPVPGRRQRRQHRRRAAGLRERAARFGAEVTDRGDEYALLADPGPGSSGSARRLTDTDLDLIRYYAAASAPSPATDCLMPVRLHGEDGFEIFCAAADAPAIWAAALAAGAGDGLVPAGLALPRHPAAGGRHAALRPRADPRAHPVPRPTGRVVALREGSDFVGRAALGRPGRGG